MTPSRTFFGYTGLTHTDRWTRHGVNRGIDIVNRIVIRSFIVPWSTWRPQRRNQTVRSSNDGKETAALRGNRHSTVVVGYGTPAVQERQTALHAPQTATAGRSAHERDGPHPSLGTSNPEEG